jgi:hypothetical protein
MELGGAELLADLPLAANLLLVLSSTAIVGYNSNSSRFVITEGHYPFHKNMLVVPVPTQTKPAHSLLILFPLHAYVL